MRIPIWELQKILQIFSSIFVTKNDYEGTEELIFGRKKLEKKRVQKLPGFDRDPGPGPGFKSWDQKLAWIPITFPA